MTPRRDTAEMVAWLRAGNAAPYVEAADRLEELDAELRESKALWKMADFAALDALRPPCPTCDGVHCHEPENLPGCPDCTDGRVPWERMVRVFTAVYEMPEGSERGLQRDELWALYGHQELLKELRGIR